MPDRSFWTNGGLPGSGVLEFGFNGIPGLTPAFVHVDKYRRGLAYSINVGLSHCLSDPDMEWISVLQDDTEYHEDWLSAILAVAHTLKHPEECLFTGHDAQEHPTVMEGTHAGIKVKWKNSCRAVHMMAHRRVWEQAMPFPTNVLGSPKRIEGNPGRGIGSDVDWWITSKAPILRNYPFVCCVPGLVRTFATDAKDSTWGNQQPEDPPLSNDAIADWERS